MNVLVTGGAGYIGSHVCKWLHSRGDTPVTYDNLSRGHRWLVRFGPLVEGDLLDSQKLKQTLQDFKIEAVIHMAAFAYVSESVHKPEHYYQNNVNGSLSLLRAMLESGVKKIVFSSTCATYGNPAYLPIDENHPQSPVNPYGHSKLFVENILSDLHASDDLEVIMLRYFNVAGADPDLEIGEWHEPETHLIPNALLVAKGLKSHLDIYGHSLPTRDGTCIRDFVHVHDLSGAHLKALDLLTSGQTKFDYINIGTGLGYTVKEVIESVERVTKSKIRTELRPHRPEDPPVLVASFDKAKKLLDWKPKFQDLDKIIETSWQWLNKVQSDDFKANNQLPYQPL